MKLIISGSRSIKDYSIVRQAIIQSKLWEKYGTKIQVVSGCAEGVDKLGEEFARKAKLDVLPYPAAWDDVEVEGAVVRYTRAGKPYNAVAGHWRNQAMAEVADEVLVVWDGCSTGSLDMLHRMLMLNKPSYLYPLKISSDMLDSLVRKGCIILVPNAYTNKGE